MQGAAMPIQDCPLSVKRLNAIVSRVPPPRRGERLISNHDAIRVNYFPEDWQPLFQDAAQKNYRQYSARRAVPTANLINDFFERRHFAGQRIIELGPGHYTFALIARALGACVVCVERDEALARFGRRLGFEVIEADFVGPGFAEQARDDAGGPFDGLWMRGVCNACTFPNEKALQRQVFDLASLVSPRGWGWATNCNVAKHIAEASARHRFEDQRIASQQRAFVDAGWKAQYISAADRTRYGLNFKGCHFIYTKGLGADG